ncbi:MAG: hypothetical protein U0K19_04525 [Bifidobacteriaceae bacterium]|nr:hypothetical protein [Bifidobacteriaceae bacterium]
MKFIKPEDLVVIENNNEFILRKGFIHVNEVTIDKNGSSPQFVQVLSSSSQREAWMSERTAISGKIFESWTSFISSMSFRLFRICLLAIVL